MLITVVTLSHEIHQLDVSNTDNEVIGNAINNLTCSFGYSTYPCYIGRQSRAQQHAGRVQLGNVDTILQLLCNCMHSAAMTVILVQQLECIEYWIGSLDWSAI